MSNLLPSLDEAAASLRSDAASGLLDAWGQSTIIDEHAGAPVIEQPIFDALHKAAGIPAAWPIGNAGVLHVYGYWFSSLQTPFGLKRDRWVQGELALALGLPAHAFRWDPAASTTLLERVTEAAIPHLTAGRTHTGSLADARVGDLHTRVALARSAATTTTALIYGIDAGSGFRLVTAFPFQGDTDAMLADFTRHPRLRWNAVEPQHHAQP